MSKGKELKVVKGMSDLRDSPALRTSGFVNWSLCQRGTELLSLEQEAVVQVEERQALQLGPYPSTGTQ